MATVTFRYTPGKTALYAYPSSQLFANWNTLKALAVESIAPDTGLYTVTVSEDYDEYYVFDGASVPASHNAHIGIRIYRKLNILICPEAFPVSPPTLVGKAITFYNDAAFTVPLTLTNEDGTAYTFDGTLLDFVIENEKKVEIAQVLGISSLTNTLTINVPAIPPQEKPCCQWSLRVASDGEVLSSHPATQNYAPLKATTTTTTTAGP